MNFVEKVFSLREIYPFNQLEEKDILSIAEIVEYKNFKTETNIFPLGKSVNFLFIALNGNVYDASNNQCLPSIIGVRSLLFDLPFEKQIKFKGEALLISKKHFFTILYECPSIIDGLIRINVDVNYKLEQ